jgi:predicted ester cyclase
MSTQSNKLSARTIAEEGFQRGNLDALDVVVTSDYVEHFPVPPGWPAGLAGLKAFITLTHNAFPDFQYTIKDMIAEDDKVVLRCRATGTQTGPFLMLPPTGKQATWTEIHIGRFVDGKLVEHWANHDQLGMLQQLDAVPPMG